MKLKYGSIIVLLLMTVIFAAPMEAYASEPKEVLKAQIDSFIDILKDSQYKKPSMKDAQKDKIWKIIHQIFDFEGVSIMAVGKNWKTFSQPEQKEFQKQFADLLGTNYLNKIQQDYTDEKVQFLEQDMVTKTKAVVKTMIIRTSAANIPVDYSMWLRNNKWQVYDVKVEGVSLVTNYRSQFNKILQNNPPSYLIERVKERVAEAKNE